MIDNKIIPVNYNPVSDTGVVITLSIDDWIIENLINYNKDRKLNILFNSKGHTAALSFEKSNSGYGINGLYIIEED
jgi:hypothetical protein